MLRLASYLRRRGLYDAFAAIVVVAGLFSLTWWLGALAGLPA